MDEPAHLVRNGDACRHCTRLSSLPRLHPPDLRVCAEILRHVVDWRQRDHLPRQAEADADRARGVVPALAAAGLADGREGGLSFAAGAHQHASPRNGGSFCKPGHSGEGRDADDRRQRGASQDRREGSTGG